MPGFQAHITGSSIVGVGYATAAWYVGGLPPVTCVLGGTVCAAAGMLPDLDNGSGPPMRESVAFAAALVPMLLLQRFQQLGLPMEAIILAGGLIYAAIRFGATWLLENYSVHRGMFHSLPAAAIAGQVTFLSFSHDDPMRRYFISGAVVLGFLTHLVLDEIWSVRLGLFGTKVKKAFGTAMKFHGRVLWANIVTYVLAIALGLLAATDASRSERAHVRQQMEQASRSYQTMPAPWNYRR
ncbi:MAG: metal-dependent hydrolase [Planctomycetia bacterium]